MTQITNDSDLLDSRDIIARIEELSAFPPSEISKEDLAELLSLKVLAEEAEPESSDWEHGATLIRRDYFVAYITDLIHDCYEMPKEMHSGTWPYRHMTIDYAAAADEADQDYAVVDFDGVEYLIRSC
jgi:hypothetical protein